MGDHQRFPSKDRRGAARLPLRIDVRADAQGETWPARTEDVGPGGCRLVGPVQLPPGAPVRLLLDPDARHPPLRVSGVVTWSSPQAPWAHGVAFAASSLEAAARWLVRRLLRRVEPELGSPAAPEALLTPVPLPPPAPAGPRPVGRVALVTRRAPRRRPD